MSETQHLHQQLEQSMTHEYSILNEEERTDAWKYGKQIMDLILYDKDCRAIDKSKFLASMDAALETYVQEKRERIEPKDQSGRCIYTGTSPVKGKVAPSSKRKEFVGKILLGVLA
jgi:hypothetical protein